MQFIVFSSLSHIKGRFNTDYPTIILEDMSEISATLAEDLTQF